MSENPQADGTGQPLDPIVVRNFFIIIALLPDELFSSAPLLKDAPNLLRQVRELLRTANYPLFAMLRPGASFLPNAAKLVAGSNGCSHYCNETAHDAESEIYKNLSKLLKGSIDAPVFITSSLLEISEDATRSRTLPVKALEKVIFTDCSHVKGRLIRSVLSAAHCVTADFLSIKGWRDMQLNGGCDFLIVIPTMGEPGLAESLISILNQDYQNYCVLVVDGSSDQRSKEVVHSLNLDTRFLILNSCDNGPYDAMNLGVAICPARWIYNLGSGDTLASDDVLSTIKTAIASNTEASIIYGNVRMIGAGPGTYDQQIYGYTFSYADLRHKTPCHQAIFYKHEIFGALDHWYRREYKICADWELNVRVWNQFNHIFIDNVIANFVRGGMSSTQFDDKFFNDLDSLWLSAM
jgi:hypothetical protein